MKTKDMHAKSAVQLEQHAEKLGKQLAETRAKMISRNDTNVRQVRSLKRERARALTIATQKKQESEEK